MSDFSEECLITSKHLCNRNLVFRFEKFKVTSYRYIVILELLLSLYGYLAIDWPSSTHRGYLPSYILLLTPRSSLHFADSENICICIVDADVQEALFYIFLNNNLWSTSCRFVLQYEVTLLGIMMFDYIQKQQFYQRCHAFLISHDAKI